MNLIVSHGHLWYLAALNVGKTRRKINSFCIVRRLPEELNVVFSVLLSTNLWGFETQTSFPNFPKKLPSLRSFDLSIESELCFGLQLDTDLWLKR